MNPKELFVAGHNCAQSVFLPFAEEKQVNRNVALSMMSPFGGGIAKTDNLCGAVTGAIAAIGLSKGHSDPDDTETKQACNEKVQEFIKQFKSEFQHIHCTGLLNYNLSDEIEAKMAQESGVFETKCTRYVERASELVKEILNEYPKS